MTKKLIEIKPEVAKALDKKKPVIALESTIIAHGMPYPQNLKVAKELEEITREAGVVPATICFLDGKAKIGLTELELKLMATSSDVEKVSIQDMGKILFQKRNGATTVASTMFLANQVGIKVFATGGIGGVHRNAENTFDISADLHEFTRSNVVVVSAGAKAILDLDKTLETLETLGVPVLGYKTNKFPAFYSHSSPFEIETIDSAQEIAHTFKYHTEIGNKGGTLIANPIPPKDEIPYEVMEDYIEQALTSCEKKKIKGKEVTPYLLSELVKITNKKSLASNIKLVKNNVKLACEIAKQYYS